MRSLSLLSLECQSRAFENVRFFDQYHPYVYYIKNSVYELDTVTRTTRELTPKHLRDVIAIKRLHFEQKLCIATKDKLTIIDLSTYEKVVVEFEGEITAISWLQCDNVVVVVFEDGKVVTYNVDYVEGTLMQIGASELGAHVPDTLYVGWGSENTQFRGSEGKKRPNPPPEAELPPVSDKIPRITWRGDGTMFAINYWKEDKREFIVYEYPCIPRYRSDPCPGLQSLIDWKPVGNMIATVTKMADNKQQVVFFEKNAQKRYSVNVDFGNNEIVDLKWSGCAEILAIHSVSIDGNYENIHLLTCSNFKWYEKQRLTFPLGTVKYFDWYLEPMMRTYTFVVVTTNDVIKYTFTNRIDGMAAYCGVVNGNELQLFDFNEAITPPLASELTITIENGINFVVFKEDSIVIVDSMNNLLLFEKKQLKSPKFSVNLADLSIVPLACHSFIDYEDGVVFIAEKSDGERDFYQVNMEGDIVKIGNSIEPVRDLFYVKNCNITPHLQQLAESVYSTETVPTNTVRQAVQVISNKSYLFQLNCFGYFHVNEVKICQSVTSFILFADYLLLTTSMGKMHCVRLTEELLNSMDDTTVGKSYTRDIEVGGVIVAAIPKTPKIVLQMPRGNLETISCALIMIDKLDRMLEMGEWQEALRFIRLEKLNANLLFDLNPERFLQNIDKFVTGARTVNELNNICLEIEAGNVLETVYLKREVKEPYPEKIKKIFRALLNYFDSVDYLPYIITIMVVSLHFFTLKDAMLYVQDLLKRSQENGDLKRRVIDAVSTLKTYGCDQEKLYTEALLLYDLDLAHFVVSCCQMDPRVYEAHLAELEAMSQVRRRFAINLYAKKPKAAIAYLIRCRDATEDEILSFIREHNVAHAAFKTLPKFSSLRPLVTKMFADELAGRGRHPEAAAILHRCGLLEDAMRQYKAALKWREVLGLMQKLPMQREIQLGMVREMAAEMVQKKEIADAVFLYERILHDHEKAIGVCVEHGRYEDALYIAKNHGRRDIIENLIVPALKQTFEYLKGRVEELRVDFNNRKLRLMKVRKLKRAQRMKMLSKDRLEGDNDDLFSDSGSSVVSRRSSRSSRSSTMSSRNRRKDQRKREDLREGGVYEDIALIKALHGIITEVYSKSDEVYNSCLLLVHETDEHYDTISSLYKGYASLDKEILEGLPEIWIPIFSPPNQGFSQPVDVDFLNMQFLDVKYRNPPARPKEWTMDIF